jgi:hypothetical protein
VSIKTKAKQKAKSVGPLASKGFGTEQLNEMKKIMNAEKSDLDDLYSLCLTGKKCV